MTGSTVLAVIDVEAGLPFLIVSYELFFPNQSSPGIWESHTVNDWLVSLQFCLFQNLLL